mgnify:CR=1 FL=1
MHNRLINYHIFLCTKLVFDLILLFTSIYQFYFCPVFKFPPFFPLFKTLATSLCFVISCTSPEYFPYFLNFIGRAISSIQITSDVISSTTTPMLIFYFSINCAYFFTNHNISRFPTYFSPPMLGLAG